ncbi:hypothetical protein PENPOL_c012G02121 [Penicillium polonicum]|uniref:Uncharacterized protein n=1 Tax=Penicillium polonicum TaxID=60169 RepID=A0A1V6NCT5_PENPO|nr:hypothetical protein PENPOL_c012G02121 [Penicillium polonicum]
MAPRNQPWKYFCDPEEHPVDAVGDKGNGANDDGKPLNLHLHIPVFAPIWKKLSSLHAF